MEEMKQTTLDQIEGVDTIEMSVSSRYSRSVNPNLNAHYTFSHQETISVDKSVVNTEEQLDAVRTALWDKANEMVDLQMVDAIAAHETLQ